jgi:rubrerythrin
MGELAELPQTSPYDTDPEFVTPRKLNLRCNGCGYGVLRPTPPPRCPMCQAENAWIHAPRDLRAVLAR